MVTKENRLQVSKARLFINLGILIGLSLFLASQFGEARELVSLIVRAKYRWLLLALLIQVATYIFDGAKWHISIKPYGYGLKLRELGRMALQQLSMNQFIPSVGMAGNAIVAREMLKLNIPGWIVAQSMSIDILSLLASYCAMAVVAIFLLYGIAPAWVIWFLVVFLFFFIIFTLAFWHFLYNHRRWRILNWFKRFKIVRQTLSMMSQIPDGKVIPAQMFFKASVLRIAIFVLDGLTLWVLMIAIGSPATLTASFIALIAGSIGGIVSFLPAGIGGFEAACAGILVLFGTPLGAALAGTLLLRGFVLWLPLIPGLIFLRKEIFPYELIGENGLFVK